MKRIKEQRCLCCSKLFIPDYRNRSRQEYCATPECRAVSKAASQRRWLAQNPDYFKGSDHVERVREWRRNNPGRKPRSAPSYVLQETCSPISSLNQQVDPPLPPATQTSSVVLQDFCITQHPVFVGLIAHLTGFVLQDDIADVTRRLEQLGHDVRGTNPTTGVLYAPQTASSPRSPPHRTFPVQLGGSPPGP